MQADAMNFQGSAVDLPPSLLHYTPVKQWSVPYSFSKPCRSSMDYLDLHASVYDSCVDSGRISIITEHHPSDCAAAMSIAKQLSPSLSVIYEGKENNFVDGSLSKAKLAQTDRVHLPWPVIQHGDVPTQIYSWQNEPNEREIVVGNAFGDVVPSAVPHQAKSDLSFLIQDSLVQTKPVRCHAEMETQRLSNINETKGLGCHGAVLEGSEDTVVCKPEIVSIAVNDLQTGDHMANYLNNKLVEMPESDWTSQAVSDNVNPEVNSTTFVPDNTKMVSVGVNVSTNPDNMDIPSSCKKENESNEQLKMPSQFLETELNISPKERRPLNAKSSHTCNVTGSKPMPNLSDPLKCPSIDRLSHCPESSRKSAFGVSYIVPVDLQTEEIQDVESLNVDDVYPTEVCKSNQQNCLFPTIVPVKRIDNAKCHDRERVSKGKEYDSLAVCVRYGEIPQNEYKAENGVIVDSMYFMPPIQESNKESENNVETRHMWLDGIANTRARSPFEIRYPFPIIPQNTVDVDISISTDTIKGGVPSSSTLASVLTLTKVADEEYRSKASSVEVPACNKVLEKAQSVSTGIPIVEEIGESTKCDVCSLNGQTDSSLSLTSGNLENGMQDYQKAGYSPFVINKEDPGSAVDGPRYNLNAEVNTESTLTDVLEDPTVNNQKNKTECRNYCTSLQDSSYKESLASRRIAAAKKRKQRNRHSKANRDDDGSSIDPDITPFVVKQTVEILGYEGVKKIIPNKPRLAPSCKITVAVVSGEQSVNTKPTVSELHGVAEGETLELDDKTATSAIEETVGVENNLRVCESDKSKVKDSSWINRYKIHLRGMEQQMLKTDLDSKYVDHVRRLNRKTRMCFSSDVYGDVMTPSSHICLGSQAFICGDMEETCISPTSPQSHSLYSASPRCIDRHDHHDAAEHPASPYSPNDCVNRTSLMHPTRDRIFYPRHSSPRRHRSSSRQDDLRQPNQKIINLEQSTPRRSSSKRKSPRSSKQQFKAQKYKSKSGNVSNIGVDLLRNRQMSKDRSLSSAFHSPKMPIRRQSLKDSHTLALQQNDGPRKRFIKSTPSRSNHGNCRSPSRQSTSPRLRKHNPPSNLSEENGIFAANNIDARLSPRSNNHNIIERFNDGFDHSPNVDHLTRAYNNKHDYELLDTRKTKCTKNTSNHHSALSHTVIKDKQPVDVDVNKADNINVAKNQKRQTVSVARLCAPRDRNFNKSVQTHASKTNNVPHTAKTNILEEYRKEKQYKCMTRRSKQSELEFLRKKKNKQRMNLFSDLQSYHNLDVSPRVNLWNGLNLESNHVLRGILKGYQEDAHPSTPPTEPVPSTPPKKVEHTYSTWLSPSKGSIPNDDAFDDVDILDMGSDVDADMSQATSIATTPVGSTHDGVQPKKLSRKSVGRKRTRTQSLFDDIEEIAGEESTTRKSKKMRMSGKAEGGHQREKSDGSIASLDGKQRNSAEAKRTRKSSNSSGVEPEISSDEPNELQDSEETEEVSDDLCLVCKEKGEDKKDNICDVCGGTRKLNRRTYSSNRRLYPILFPYTCIDKVDEQSAFDCCGRKLKSRGAPPKLPFNSEESKCGIERKSIVEDAKEFPRGDSTQVKAAEFCEKFVGFDTNVRVGDSMSCKANNVAPSSENKDKATPNLTNGGKATGLIKYKETKAGLIITKTKCIGVKSSSVPPSAAGGEPEIKDETKTSENCKELEVLPSECTATITSPCEEVKQTDESSQKVPETEEIHVEEIEENEEKPREYSNEESPELKSEDEPVSINENLKNDKPASLTECLKNCTFYNRDFKNCIFDNKHEFYWKKYIPSYNACAPQMNTEVKEDDHEVNPKTSKEKEIVPTGTPPVAKDYKPVETVQRSSLQVVSATQPLVQNTSKETADVHIAQSSKYKETPGVFIPSVISPPRKHMLCSGDNYWYEPPFQYSPRKPNIRIPRKRGKPESMNYPLERFQFPYERSKFDDFKTRSVNNRWKSDFLSSNLWNFTSSPGRHVSSSVYTKPPRKRVSFYSPVRSYCERIGGAVGDYSNRNYIDYLSKQTNGPNIAGISKGCRMPVFTCTRSDVNKRKTPHVQLPCKTKFHGGDNNTQPKQNCKPLKSILRCSKKSYVERCLETVLKNEKQDVSPTNSGQRGRIVCCCCCCEKPGTSPRSQKRRVNSKDRGVSPGKSPTRRTACKCRCICQFFPDSGDSLLPENTLEENKSVSRDIQLINKYNTVNGDSECPDTLNNVLGEDEINPIPDDITKPSEPAVVENSPVLQEIWDSSENKAVNFNTYYPDLSPVLNPHRSRFPYNEAAARSGTTPSLYTSTNWGPSTDTHGLLCSSLNTEGLRHKLTQIDFYLSLNRPSLTSSNTFRSSVNPRRKL